MELERVNSKFSHSGKLGLGKSILAIDDCPELLILIRMILEGDGYNVFTAVSGQEGLEYLTKIDPPNLILLDFQMNVMSGSEFLEILEKERPEIYSKVPVLFLSAVNVAPDSKAKGFIQKPIFRETFLGTINRFLSEGDK